MENITTTPPIIKIIGFVTITCLLFFKGIPVNVSVKTDENIPVTIRMDSTMTVKNDSYSSFKIRHGNE
jgi:hypothetical protein